MIILKQDSRDAKFHEHFGQVTEFPLELNFDTPIPDATQQPGNTECTCYSCCDIATDDTMVVYDIDDLYNRIPHDSNGANPRDALSESVKGGFMPIGQAVRVKPFSSYWSAQTGDMDAFDNVRSAMLIAKLPVAVWSPWFSEWLNQFSTILPPGRTVSSYHMYVLDGWKVINGVTYFIVEAWIGRKLYMSREVFNATLGYAGSGTAVLSTVEIDGRRIKTIKEKLIDAITNLIILLKAQLLTLQK